MQAVLRLIHIWVVYSVAKANRWGLVRVCFWEFDVNPPVTARVRTCSVQVKCSLNLQQYMFLLQTKGIHTYCRVGR